MNYPTAIVIAAALVADAVFAGKSVGASSEVGRYQIKLRSLPASEVNSLPRSG